MGRFFARATRGIEWIAAAEITGRGSGTVQSVGHREVAFSAVDPAPLLALRTVDDVFALAGRVGGVGRSRSSLAAVASIASSADAALAVVAGLRPVVAGAPFDVTASFLGRRNYTRFDIEDAVGPALARATGGEYVARREGPAPATGLSWRVHVRDGEGILGLRLAPRPLHRRASTWATVPGTLHPPVAAALVLLAGVVPGQWLGDPFCGSGTILAEYLHLAAGGRAVGVDASGDDGVPGRTTLAAGHVSGVAAGRAVGVDASGDAVAAARTNLTAAGGGDRSLVVRGDAADLPVRPGGLDVVATNPPWGRTVSLHRSRPAAESRAWQAIGDSLGRLGRLVALAEARPHPPVGWVGPVLSFGPLSVSGSKPSVHVYTRPGDPGGGLPPPDALLAAELARFVHHASG